MAKFRAARTLWAQVMRDRFGATNPRAQALRFHAQTGGSTLTAQQPENNVVRVAVQALSAVCGGAQSLHTNSFDEALALPSEHAARSRCGRSRSWRTRRARPTTADPLGGSYYIEALTAELEERARELIERVDELGGAVAAIEAGFVQGEIEEAAFRYQTEVESGESVDRRRERVRPGGRRAVELHRARPGGGAAPARAHGARPHRAKRRGAAAALAAVRDRAGTRRTCCRRCARRSAPAARWERSAAASGSCGARTTRS